MFRLMWVLLVAISIRAIQAVSLWPLAVVLTPPTHVNALTWCTAFAETSQRVSAEVRFYALLCLCEQGECK